MITMEAHFDAQFLFRFQVQIQSSSGIQPSSEFCRVALSPGMEHVIVEFLLLRHIIPVKAPKVWDWYGLHTDTPEIIWYDARL
jgi:hypothetical protein